MKAKVKATGEIIEVERVIDAYGDDRYIHNTEVSGGAFYQASDLDFLPEKETAELEGWVARDQSGAICFYDEEPERSTGSINNWCTEHPLKYYRLPDDSFPSVTWQSEPKKVRIKIEEIEE